MDRTSRPLRRWDPQDEGKYVVRDFCNQFFLPLREIFKKACLLGIPQGVQLFTHPLLLLWPLESVRPYIWWWKNPQLQKYGSHEPKSLTWACSFKYKKTRLTLNNQTSLSSLPVETELGPAPRQKDHEFGNLETNAALLQDWQLLVDLSQVQDMTLPKNILKIL